MTLPSSYQSRTTATFATNGVLWTRKANEPSIYIDETFQDVDRDRSLTVKPSNRTNRSQLGFVLRMQSYDRQTADKSDLQVTFGVQVRPNVALDFATLKGVAIGVVDFGLSNYDDLIYIT